ncbi:hypothetical protein CRENBAI_010864 [Crenichthys baileyi]|uniref:Uncharacterized protein n=1 Tax=Crenichthys baileyi TaxID=28760 RepID=A0AAV9R4Q8_9TELE
MLSQGETAAGGSITLWDCFAASAADPSVHHRHKTVVTDMCYPTEISSLMDFGTADCSLGKGTLLLQITRRCPGDSRKGVRGTDGNQEREWVKAVLAASGCVLNRYTETDTTADSGVKQSQSRGGHEVRQGGGEGRVGITGI